MSSILKALKRVETDPDQGGPGPTGAPPPWTVRTRLRPPWTDRIWEWALLRGRLVLALVLAGTMAGAILFGSVWLSLFPGAVETGPLLRETDKTASRPLAASPRLAQDQKVPKPESVARPPKKLVPIPAVPRPVIPGPVASPLSLKPIVSADTPQPRMLQPPASPEAVLPMPESAGLTAQAISWSPEAGKRITVINERVLHIGDTVKGYTVKEIEPDRITLVRNGTAHGLVFAPGHP